MSSATAFRVSPLTAATLALFTAGVVAQAEAFTFDTVRLREGLVAEHWSEVAR